MTETMLTNNMLQQTARQLLSRLRTSGRHVVTGSSLSSPRAVGDAVQDFLGNNLPECFPEGVIGRFESGFERRSMEDLAFYDRQGNYYAVDVKTHNRDTNFNMPNLISIQRLAKFYENDTNHFLIFMVEYRTTENGVDYTDCHFVPIENFSWKCLTIGALGWGQIQIADSNRLLIDYAQSRRDWMLQLCDTVQAFYEAEIGKINTRSTWFGEVRRRWESHP